MAQPTILQQHSQDMASLMDLSLLPAVALCVVSWLLWRTFRSAISTASLDIIPGPSSPSIVYGESCVHAVCVATGFIENQAI